MHTLRHSYSYVPLIHTHSGTHNPLTNTHIYTESPVHTALNQFFQLLFLSSPIITVAEIAKTGLKEEVASAVFNLIDSPPSALFNKWSPW